MAIAEPDPDYGIYEPSDDDIVDTIIDGPADPELTPDDDPNVAEPDADAVVVEGEVAEIPGDMEGFTPGNVSEEVDIPQGPIYLEVDPGAIEIEDPNPDADEDEGDVYSASAFEPDDDAWAAVPDGSTAAIATFASSGDGDLTDDDFIVEPLTSSLEEVDDDRDTPVQYEIQGRSDVAEWVTLATVPASEVTAEVRGLPTEENWIFRIRAIFASGDVGEWSAETNVDLPRDMIAPPRPAAPSATGKRGVVTITSTGQGAGGEDMPPDYQHTVVWQSASGQVGTWNAVGLIFGAGQLMISDIEYYVPMYFSLSNRDLAGNESARSAVVEVTLKPLVEEPDIKAELDRIDEETGGLVTEAKELGSKLDGAMTELEASGKRLADAEVKLNETFGLVGSASSKADAAKAAADTAKTEAANALGIAAGKGDVLIQSAAPATAMRKATTLWIDTTNGANTPKRWSGTAWVAVTDKAVVDAAKAAAAADAKAQQAAKDAADAAAKAESAIRQAPTLFEWTADFNPGNSTTQKKTATEVSYDGNQAAAQYAHRLTSKSVPISGNRVYRMQAIVSNTGTAAARFQSGFYLNNASGGYVSSLWPSDSTNPVPAGASRITVTSTPRVGDLAAGVEMASAAIYFLDSQPMILHDMKVVDVTDIISAQETADSALTMAGSKTTVFYGTTNPTGTGSRGDVWRKTDANKNIIAEWFWGAANKWESSQVTNELISNLDVGKLVAGSATINSAVVSKIAAQTASIQKADIKNLTVSSGTFSSAVIDKLWADVIHARKITADMIVVSDTTNAYPTPYFERGLGWLSSTSGWEHNATWNSGKGAIRYINSTASSVYMPLLPDRGIPVIGGAEYWISAKVAVTKGGSPDVQMRTYTYDYAGTNTNGRAGSSVAITSTNNGYVEVGGSFVAPANAVTLQPRITFYSPEGVGENMWVSEVRVNRMAGAELIVDGAVTAAKVAANAITAGKVAANAITADKISSGAVTAIKVAANAITADKISASAVTGAKIAANTITAGNIAANAITASELAAGAVKATNIAADAITGKTISGGKVTGASITGGSVTMTSGGYSVKMLEDAYGGAIGFTVPNSTTNGTIRAEVEKDSGATTGTAQLVLRSPASKDFPARGYIKINSWRGDGNELNQPSVTLYGDVYLPQHCTMSGGGRVNILGGGGAMLTVDSSVVSASTYNRTYSSAANMHITSYGTFGRATSALKYKVDVQPVDVSTYEDALLGIEHKSWLDKAEARDYEDYLAWEAEHRYQPIPREMVETPTAPPKRHFGAIADEFHEAGLGQFVTYDQNGEVEGLAYDRVGVALLPIVRKQRDRITQLEDQMAALMARVEALEAA